jgi:hypothetical protein
MVNSLLHSRSRHVRFSCEVDQSHVKALYDGISLVRSKAYHVEGDTLAFLISTVPLSVSQLEFKGSCVKTKGARRKVQTNT